MTKTTNYQLPQWEMEDPVRREDFNGAMANIDAGITAAREVADSAQALADAAYSPNNKPYVAGTYTGNHGTQQIELGFRPSFILISGDEGAASLTTHYQYLGYYLGVISNELTYDTVTITDTGFTVVHNSDSYPRLNVHLQKYIYVAFR